MRLPLASRRTTGRYLAAAGALNHSRTALPGSRCCVKCWPLKLQAPKSVSRIQALCPHHPIPESQASLSRCAPHLTSPPTSSPVGLCAPPAPWQGPRLLPMPPRLPSRHEAWSTRATAAATAGDGVGAGPGRAGARVVFSSVAGSQMPARAITWELEEAFVSTASTAKGSAAVDICL